MCTGTQRQEVVLLDSESFDCFVSPVCGGFVGGPQRRSRIALKGARDAASFSFLFFTFPSLPEPKYTKEKMFDVHLLMDTSFGNSHRSVYTCDSNVCHMGMLLT